MKLIFEYRDSAAGSYISESTVPEYSLPDEYRGEDYEDFPGVSETGLCRHYSALASKTFGLNKGFYPLGSCTMKYNPKISEDMASLRGGHHRCSGAYG